MNADELNDVNHKVIFYLNIILSSVSLSILILILILVNVHKEVRGLRNYFLIVILISEMLNCFSKLLTIAKNKNNENIIGYIQLCLSIFSDFCTLLTNLCFSFKIYDLIINNSKCFQNIIINLLVKIAIILIPFILGGIFILLNYLHFESNPNDSSEYGNWVWFSPELSISIYAIIFFIILLNLYFDVNSLKFIQKKKEQTQNMEYFESLDDSINKGSNLSDRICELFIKILILPISTCFIWFILFIYRLWQAILQFRYQNNNLDNSLFVFFTYIHAILSSVRGTIYSFIYLVIVKKIGDWILRMICCKCLKKGKPKEVFLNEESIDYD